MAPTIPNLTLPDFLKTPLSNIHSTTVLLGIFIIFSLIYITVSGILIYHWQAYGMNSKGIVIGRTLFLLVSVILYFIAVSVFLTI
jgi:hypothetical protein